MMTIKEEAVRAVGGDNGGKQRSEQQGRHEAPEGKKHGWGDPGR